MKKYFLLMVLVYSSASALQAAETAPYFNANPLEVGALAGKFGMTAVEDEQKQRLILAGLACLRFYQAMNNKGRGLDLTTLAIENALIVFYKDLFAPKKDSQSFEEDKQDKDRGWALFWKLSKADLFGTFFAYFCQMRNNPDIF